MKVNKKLNTLINECLRLYFKDSGEGSRTKGSGMKRRIVRSKT